MDHDENLSSDDSENGIYIKEENSDYEDSISKEDNQIEFIAVEDEKVIKQEVDVIENNVDFVGVDIQEDDEIQDPLNSGSLVENRGKYMCPSNLCGKFFTTHKRLKEHISNDHKYGFLKPPNTSETNESGTEEEVGVQNEEQSEVPAGIEIVDSAKLVDSAKPIKKSFICAMCEKVCSNKPNLLRHIEKVHEKSGQVFFCPRCPKYFGYKQVRDRHVAANACHSRRNKNPQNLNTGDQNFETQKSWYYGVDSGAGKMIYKIKPKNSGIKTDSHEAHKCKECGSLFSSRTILKNHMYAIHPGLKDRLDTATSEDIPSQNQDLQNFVDCSVKEVSLASGNMISFYETPILEPTKSILPTSDSESRDVMKLKMKKPFACPRCSKTFGTKQILKNHLNRKKRCILLNTEAVQYNGSQAVAPVQYNDHTSWEGRNPYVVDQNSINERQSFKTGNFCHLCNKTFTQNRNLQRHYFLVHENDPLKKNRFVCSRCNKAFSLKQTLQRHSERNTCSAKHRSYNNIRNSNTESVSTEAPIDKRFKDLKTIEMKSKEKITAKDVGVSGNFRYILPKPIEGTKFVPIAPMQPAMPPSVNIVQKPMKLSSDQEKMTVKNMDSKLKKHIKEEFITDTELNESIESKIEELEKSIESEIEVDTKVKIELHEDPIENYGIN